MEQGVEVLLTRVSQTSSDHAEQPKSADPLPNYPQIGRGDSVTFTSEARSGGWEYYPFVDALAPLLDAD